MSGDEAEITLRVRGLENRTTAIQVISNIVVRSLYYLDGDPEKFHYEIEVDGKTFREGPQR